MRLLTLSDSDSYLKWAVGLTDAAPEHWGVRHLVLDNVIAPSNAQIGAVLEDYPRRPIGRVAGWRLARTVRRLAPDALLLAATGPAIDAMLDLLAWGGLLGPERPALITGLPGISYPANDLAVQHRRGCDVMVLHSEREREAYAEVVARIGGPRLALASLPFLATVQPADPSGRDVIFAAQSLVPPEAGQRRAILDALASLPPELEPVVKVRALAGERQAHNEALPYEQLWRGMAQARPLEFRAGSMAHALRHAVGFVTVSSTAAIEALAAGVPSVVLDEFGVSDELINTVFEGSGLLGGLDRVAAGEFAPARPEWLAANYFHGADANDWIAAAEQAVADRRTPSVGQIARGGGGWTTRVRRHARVQPPRWVWRALTVSKR